MFFMLYVVLKESLLWMLCTILCFMSNVLFGMRIFHFSYWLIYMLFVLPTFTPMRLTDCIFLPNLLFSRHIPGLERDKFDNKTVTFEGHIKEEHNMWHYLFFIVLVKVKDSTEYTGPESYVAEMIKVNEKHRHPKTHIHHLSAGLLFFFFCKWVTLSIRPFCLGIDYSLVQPT